MVHPVDATEAAVASLGVPEPLPFAASELAAFCARLGHDFRDPSLLVQALTHRSWCAEHAGFASNERLEFLGDAVLGLVVTDEIYTRLPDAEEGQLSRVRAAVVCAPALAEMAEELEVGPVLLLGKGEAAAGGRSRPSILADAMEALIGAVHLDGGLEPAAELVGRLVGPRLATAGSPDHKSRLHELVAREPQRQVAYEISEDGPEHDKTFRAVVLLDGEAAGSGVGRSKKQAEQAAAREAWRRIDREGGVESAGDGEPPAGEGAHG